jgi:hypothetical protein
VSLLCERLSQLGVIKFLSFERLSPERLSREAAVAITSTIAFPQLRGVSFDWGRAA